MWTRGWREEIWSRLDQPWDLVVIGGGITGAGILAEAVRHGKRALLVEAQDFASGTSSRSTKLVHGGLRYLRQGQFLVTRKSVKERERLMSEGHGLVDDLGFFLSAFPGDEMPKWAYGMGLMMYDALAWKWAHEKYSREELLAAVPQLAGSEVLGGYRYYDAQTDDARLVLRVMREAVRAGGTALSYAKVTSLLRTADGHVRGVVLSDTAPGGTRTAEVEATVVINATGAWADDVRAHVGGEKRLRRIRGSHLTFPHHRLPVPEAVSLIHPRDGRAMFAIPWEGVTIVGTTDIDHPSLDEEPCIAASEVEYLLEACARAFPTSELREADVITTWAGVRPVIDTGKKDPSKESREHAIWKEDGLLTITGGKLTTFAVMARDALGEVEAELGELEERTRIFAKPPEDVRWPSAMDEGRRIRTLGRYGADAAAIVADAALCEPIGGSIAHWAELRHAARDEGVVTLSDLLLRRVRLGLLLPRGGQDHMAEIRAVAQPELGWDDATWEREQADYAATWAKAYSLPR